MIDPSGEDVADLSVRVVSTIAAVAAETWDRCANPVSLEPSDPSEPRGERHNPFLSHAFLSALEEAGCTGPRAGWQPVHVVVETANGDVVGVAPTYIKSHSQGEYVFDQGWADAYERAGGHYYPKIQVAVPFTPVTGRRLLVAEGPFGDAAATALCAGLDALRTQVKASSIHLTFLTKPEWDMLGERDYLQRTDQQFHFINDGYADFETFLAALASRKRKMIRRERKDALANGITIEHVTGRDLTEAHWDAFYRFYMDTGARKWGRPYLNRKFFSLIGQSMPERVLLVLAKRENRYIAGAINFIGDDALYGRNWGAVEEHPFLHFEVCYYQAIDFALSRGLARVEAGAQGEHKLARGYRAVPTYSAHHIADRRLAQAVSDYLERERAYAADALEAYAEHAPFRRPEPEQE
ncbi:GNAT family N-acetyltransferase [Lichenihabitans psoromatis]|uniref:GNAT family N-acetyltransferase n=1 Tax=Lichenihabitans psoromatis TaxID=2528642 RepID=UPI0010356286|nr:GNAT family N-acetyltransferase [Lichenihabitans psoromatis]